MAKKIAEYPINCKSVSLRPLGVTFGLTISRGSIDLDYADEYFTGREIVGTLLATKKKDANGQKMLGDDMGPPKFRGTFTSQGFNVRGEVIKVSLAAAMPEEAAEAMALFSFRNKEGFLRIERADKLVEPEEPQEESAAEESDSDE